MHVSSGCIYPYHFSGFAGINPFAMTTPAAAGGAASQQNNNPFALQQQPQRVPMNQMSTSQSMGFTSTTSTGTILPTPLMPNNQPMAAQPQANMMYGQYNNPFL